MKKLLLTLIMILATKTAFADKIVFLDDPDDSLKARAQFILTAEREIRVQYFTIEDDEVSASGLSLLRYAAERGVKVRIIVDALHNLMSDEKQAALLLNPNIEIREYNNFKIYAPWRYSKRMHDKAMIIDRQALISGGRNVANGYFGKFSDNDDDPKPVLEDTDALVLESQAINEAAQYFDSLWFSRFVKPVDLGWKDKKSLAEDACDDLRWRDSSNEYDNCEYRRKQNIKKIQKAQLSLNVAYQKTIAEHGIPQSKQAVLAEWDTLAVRTGLIDYIYDNPVGQSSSLEKPEAVENNIAKQLYRAIGRAYKNVVIVTPYFVVTPEQVELFRTLRQRGVKVEVFTNGENSNDVPAAHVGFRRTVHLAVNEGVKVWVYNGPDSLHAKMVLIDNQTLFVGSYNWDFRSQNLNREVGIIADITAVEQKNHLQDDIQDKLARILSRSTLLGMENRMNTNIGHLNERQVRKLANMIRSAHGNTWLWELLFPIVKEQL
ncbi:MAG: phosphatidylserine/phosphatidylglycerophosphate/cardiolipin synthase family protein [Pseudobdellovibrio sp.]|nr:phosphatidylserine/phosphatidylglycerophosphate/cardiolipin synthase family protein [Pseudobdellovibrio sp.]